MKKFKLNPFNWVGATALVLIAPTALANGGHFLVDDAAITDPGHCQLESWVSRVDSHTTLIAVPACTTQRGWELSVPFVYDWQNSQVAALGFEAKTMLAEGQSSALAISSGIEFDQVADTFAGGFINVPYSHALNSAIELHVNLGTAYTHEDSAWDATYGLATTFAIAAKTALIVEGAAVGDDRPTLAVGLRHATGRVELDTSVARDRENRETIYTIGLNIAF
ncbi:MAG: hypothetical protein LAT77_06620 [Aliidiomarina sp.]|uniref:hypothetical protein n=1 Tax=Aliidiomarina sp. TaxID=1872439 RepID=UPI0025C554B8|nr:hypothetical protein [Aliidiomarina sp.]MCH8501568.1 hypothetical protein [Aliidiomarina sp.]